MPLVLIIWGCIIYKIYLSLEHKQSHTFEGNTVSKTTQNSAITDTFTIIDNYRDPFLLKVPSAKANQSAQGKYLLSNRTGLTANVSTVVFPEVKYFGLITNSQKKKKVGLLRISNQDLIVQEGELQQTIKILHMCNDSVIIMLGKVKKTIRKNK
jgi:hypothetical protein